MAACRRRRRQTRARKMCPRALPVALPASITAFLRASWHPRAQHPSNSSRVGRRGRSSCRQYRDPWGAVRLQWRGGQETSSMDKPASTWSPVHPGLPRLSSDAPRVDPDNPSENHRQTLIPACSHEVDKPKNKAVSATTMPRCTVDIWRGLGLLCAVKMLCGCDALPRRRPQKPYRSSNLGG